jgi:hypothetical protein
MRFYLPLFLIALGNLSYPVQCQGSEQPDSVSVGLRILDIRKVDDRRESIQGEFIFYLSWTDTSLTQPGQKDDIRISLEEANAPMVLVRNLEELEEFRTPLVQVSPQGRATYRHRYVGTIRQSFDFQRFPFDRQTWAITLFNAETGNFRMVPEPNQLGLLTVDSLSVTNWQVQYEGYQSRMLYEFNIPVQTLELTFSLKRNPVFIIWKVMVPIVLVVFMSWSVFWINPTNISAQLTVSVTAILTLVAFQFSVAQLMPPLAYLTKLDWFTIGSDIFVFLAFVETIITSYQENKNRLKVSETIDFYARFLFPLAFGVFLLLTLL